MNAVNRNFGYDFWLSVHYRGRFVFSYQMLAFACQNEDSPVRYFDFFLFILFFVFAFFSAVKNYKVDLQYFINFFMMKHFSRWGVFKRNGSKCA